MIRASNSAFTLVEIILVLTILSIIVALATPNFGKSIDKFELVKTASDINSLVRWAQSRSANENRDYELVFLNDFTSYRILRFDPAQNSDKESFQPIRSHMGRVFMIPKSIKATADVNPIKIFSDGSIEKAKVRLENKTDVKILTSGIQRGSFFILNEKDKL